MKSIKPGRGPSFMSGAGSIVAVVFGVIWTFAAAGMGAPFFFPLFGVVFVIIGIVQAVYHFKNATGNNRYSSFDITDDGEEPDPFDERFGIRRDNINYTRNDNSTVGGFCPFCGAKVESSDHEFCRKCGKKL